jgi:hypothetical protein
MGFEKWKFDTDRGPNLKTPRPGFGGGLVSGVSKFFLWGGAASFRFKINNLKNVQNHQNYEKTSSNHSHRAICMLHGVQGLSVQGTRKSRATSV